VAPSKGKKSLGPAQRGHSEEVPGNGGSKDLGSVYAQKFVTPEKKHAVVRKKKVLGIDINRVQEGTTGKERKGSSAQRPKGLRGTRGEGKKPRDSCAKLGGRRPAERDRLSLEYRKWNDSQ